jgi:hypothetical protein
MASDIEFTKGELYALMELTGYCTVVDSDYQVQVVPQELAAHFDVPDGPSLAALRTAYAKLDQWFMSDGEKEADRAR